MASQLIQASLQGRLFPLDRLQHFGDASQLGLHAGLGDDGLAPSVRHHRALVDHVKPVAQG